MASSKAKTVKDYLAQLPADRRKAIERVRTVVRKNLPAGFEETMNWGMISYEVPLARFPKTYNGQPLGYVALGAQKNYNVIYLMAAYGDKKQLKKLQHAFKNAGKKLDIGKSCVRFKSADDLELGAIGEIVAAYSLEKWLAMYQSARAK